MAFFSYHKLSYYKHFSIIQLGFNNIPFITSLHNFIPNIEKIFISRSSIKVARYPSGYLNLSKGLFKIRHINIQGCFLKWEG